MKHSVLNVCLLAVFCSCASASIARTFRTGVFLITLPNFISIQGYKNPNVDYDRMYFNDNIPKKNSKDVEVSSETVNYYTEDDIHKIQNDRKKYISPTTQAFRELIANHNKLIALQNSYINRQPIAYDNIQFAGQVRPVVASVAAPDKFTQSLGPFNQKPVRNIPLTANSEEVKKPIPAANNELVPNKENSEFETISSSINSFALNVLKAVDKGETNNVVVSPYSIAICLGLLQQGAVGETQNQISNALQMQPQKSSHAFKLLSDSITNRESKNTLKIATNIFISSAFTLNPTFKSVAMNDFKSDVTPINFNSPRLAAQQINDWISGKTDGKIKDLVSPDSLTDNSQLVLTNAVYFKGSWLHTFNPDATISGDFQLANNQKKKATFMRIRKPYKCGYDPNINSQIVILPFEGEQYSLMLVLPGEKITLDSVISNLTPSLLRIFHNMPLRDVQLELPKFNVKSDTDLYPVLNKIGVSNIFGSKSQLFNIAQYNNYSSIVSAAKHSAALSIDEKGGSAAAATSFAVVALSYDEPAVVYKADRPFLAIIWNAELAVPFFMARIENPTL